MLKDDPYTREIIGAAIYEECLERELQLRGLKCKRQVRIPIEYKGVLLSAYTKLIY